MASITKVESGWRARYRTPAGESRSRTFFAQLGRREVSHHRRGVEADRRLRRPQRRPPDLRGRRRGVARWAGVPAEHRRTHPSEPALPHPPHLPNRSLTSVRPSEVQVWVRSLTGTLAPSTVKTHHQLLAAIFAAAVNDRLISVSPVTGAKLPRAAPTEVVPILAEHVYAVARTVPARYEALVVTAAATGLRQGELLGLTLDRVDFLRRTIRVDCQLVTSSGQVPVLAAPKTPSSVRTIPAPQVALDALARHLAAWPVEEGGFIFTDEEGRPHPAQEPGAHLAQRGEEGRGAPHLPRSTPLHGVVAHCRRLVGEGGSALPRPHLGHDDARCVRPPLARRGGPHEDRHGRRP